MKKNRNAQSIEVLEKFLSEYKENPNNYAEIQEIILNENQVLGLNNDQILRKISQIYLSERHDIYLGFAVSWTERKLDGTALKCRTVYGDCYAWIAHPRVDEILNDIENCAKVAALAATLAAIWASPSGVLPIFEQAFYACIEANSIEWARQLNVGLYTDTRNSSWRYCTKVIP